MRTLALCFLILSGMLHAAETDPAPTTTAETEPKNEKLVNTAALEKIPPIDTTGWPESPSKVPGKYIWDEPAFTHWPGIVYRDEDRNVAFMIHNRFSRQGKLAEGAIGWPPGEMRAFTLPATEDALRVSGLTPLPKKMGKHTAQLKVDEESFDLPICIIDVNEEWVHADLKNGFPVDKEGIPVVLRIERPESQAGRDAGIIDAIGIRPEGKAVLLGDPMEALGSDTWKGIDAQRVEATNQRFPHHAVMVALAKMQAPWPRTIVYSPGNQALFARSWTQEEERILQVIEQRWKALGVKPKLVLALPPVPVQSYLKEQAKERRDLLRRSAIFRGWSILDLEKIAGPAEEANKVAEAAFTNYPIGEARKRIRDAYIEILKR